MNETDSNDEHDAMMLDMKEFQRIMWDQLTIEEKIVMKAYTNNVVNNKKIHKVLSAAVHVIMERYPDFDVSCVP